MKKKIGIALMVLGVVSILCAALLLGHNKIEEKRAGEESKTILALVQNEIKQGKNNFLPKKDMTVKEIDGFKYIGYISMPTINRTLPVRADWDFKTLRSAPQRYYGSIYTDDLVLASHSYIYHFGPISKLSIGDDIYFTDMDSNVTEYKVTNLETLNASDVDKMINGESDLTLFTCDYSASKRITVRCDRAK